MLKSLLTSWKPLSGAILVSLAVGDRSFCLTQRTYSICCYVKGGQKYQGQDGTGDDAADHREGHRTPEDLPGNRDHAETRSRGRQQDRPNPVARRLDHRI